MLFKIPLKFHHEKFSYHKNSLLVHDNLLKKRHTHTHTYLHQQFETTKEFGL